MIHIMAEEFAQDHQQSQLRAIQILAALVRGLPLSTYAQRGGVCPNAYVVYGLSKRGCVNLRTRGGRGVKKAGKSAYVLNGSPLST